MTFPENCARVVTGVIGYDRLEKRGLTLGVNGTAGDEERPRILAQLSGGTGLTKPHRAQKVPSKMVSVRTHPHPLFSTT
jgi:hypothetical protein